MSDQPTPTTQNVSIVDICAIIDVEHARSFLMERRRTILKELADIEHFLGLDRTVPGKKERQRQDHQ